MKGTQLGLRSTEREGVRVFAGPQITLHVEVDGEREESERRVCTCAQLQTDTHCTRSLSKEIVACEQQLNYAEQRRQ